MGIVVFEDGLDGLQELLVSWVAGSFQFEQVDEPSLAPILGVFDEIEIDLGEILCGVEVIPSVLPVPLCDLFGVGIGFPSGLLTAVMKIVFNGFKKNLIVGLFSV